MKHSAPIKTRCIWKRGTLWSTTPPKSVTSSTSETAWPWHTEVPPKYEGRGIGKELVQGVLEDIRRKKLKVVPQCPFVATYIRRHPEWMDLVLTAENK